MVGRNAAAAAAAAAAAPAEQLIDGIVRARHSIHP